jgi:flagellar motility protein MotE (MotC chaperone)
MKTGYDQHFKKAQKIAEGQSVAKPVSRKVISQDAKVLAQELRGKLRPRVQKKASRKIPWKLAGFSMLGILMAAYGLMRAEEIEKFVHSVEFAVIGAARADESKVKASTTKPPEANSVAADAGPVAKKEFTEEEINHFAKLNDRKKELDAREEELNRMDQELQVQKAELEKRLSELENTRRGISSVLEEKVQADDKKIENLVQMYSNMKPQQAARAFEEMDEGLAIEILGRMKKKNAAEIMNLVKAEKVKVLSEKYAGYKRNNN